MIQSISNSSAALNRYFNEMAGIAERIAGGFGPNSNVDIAKEIVDSMILEHAVAANVEMIRTQDEMTGALLDVFA